MAIKELRRSTKKVASKIASVSKIKQFDVEKRAQEFISKGGTVAQDNIQIKAAVGRPRALEKTVKSTVTFFNHQIVWLDRLSADIRDNSMAIIDRGTLIRAIISAISESKVDLASCMSEENVKNAIMDMLNKKK